MELIEQDMKWANLCDANPAEVVDKAGEGVPGGGVHVDVGLVADVLLVHLQPLPT